MNSSTSQSIEISDRWAWLFLCAAGLVRFLNLGFLDLQAWDEALYTVRAQSILLWGNWLDQSTHAIGGLYSALHPPLQIWMTAVVFNLLPVSEFSARLVPALAGALTLPVIFLVGKEIQGKMVGVTAALLYGLTPLAVFMSRQGQFDSLLTFWLTLSAYFFIKSLQGRHWFFVCLAGAAIGMGLLTKLYVALGIPVTYALWILIRRPEDARVHWRRLATLFAAACLIALPWHVMMTLKHGQGNVLFFLQQSSLLERSISGVEGNVKPLEVFYYLNQMAVIFPLGVAWFLFALWKAIRSKDASWFFLALWFLVFFGVFSAMRTKLDFYLLPMLVPMSLLAAGGLVSALTTSISLKATTALLSGTCITVVWSLSQSWRNAMKDFVVSSVHLQLASAQAGRGVLNLILLGSLGIVLVLILYRRDYLTKLVPHLGFVIIAPLFLVALTQVEIRDRTHYKDGAKELALYVNSQSVHRIVVAGFDRNPQLTFYTRGADIGWRDDLTVRRIVPPADTAMYEFWIEQEMSREPSDALLLIEKDKFIRYHMVNPGDFVPREFYRVFESRRYTGYLRTSGRLYAHLEPAESILLSH